MDVELSDITGVCVRARARVCVCVCVWLVYMCMHVCDWCVCVCVCVRVGVWVGGCKVNRSERGFPRQGKAACIFAYILYLCFEYVPLNIHSYRCTWLLCKYFCCCCVVLHIAVVWTWSVSFQPLTITLLLSWWLCPCVDVVLFMNKRAI